MKKHAFFSVDVEEDLHSGMYNGITEGIPKILKLLDSEKIKATFFVTGKVLTKYPKILKKVKSKGHDIGIHGYSHKRFDSMSISEKKEEILNSIKIYKKIFKSNPLGFRAPQHSIDSDTLSILQNNKFKYDSSVCTKNLLLLRHLLKWDSNGKEIIRSFFGKSNPYKISPNFIEIPVSSPLIAIGGFQTKVYPKWLISFVINLHYAFNIPINFVMHSWDVIDVKGSRTSKYARDRADKLPFFVKEAKKKHSFIKMGDLI